VLRNWTVTVTNASPTVHYKIKQQCSQLHKSGRHNRMRAPYKHCVETFVTWYLLRAPAKQL